MMYGFMCTSLLYEKLAYSANSTLYLESFDILSIETKYLLKYLVYFHYFLLFICLTYIAVQYVINYFGYGFYSYILVVDNNTLYIFVIIVLCENNFNVKL